MTRVCEWCKGTGEWVTQWASWYVMKALCGYCDGKGVRETVEEPKAA